MGGYYEIPIKDNHPAVRQDLILFFEDEGIDRSERDVTLGEDASQTRVKGAPAVLAALNGGILALMDFFGVKNVAKQMGYFCEYPREALQMLLGKLSRQNR